MNNRFQPFGFSGNLQPLNAFESLNKMQIGANHGMDTTLRLDSMCGNSNAYSPNTKGIKRKWRDVGGAEGPEDCFTLVLGVGRSPSSSDTSKMSSTTACTLSSAKETDEETSADLGLCFQLCLGSSDSSPSPKNGYVDSGKTQKANPQKAGSMFDLQLSLSTGPPTSVITSTSPISVHYQNILETSVTANAFPIDDGSTSSRWRAESTSRQLFGTPQTASSFILNQTTGKVDYAQSRPDLLNSAAPSSVTCASGLTSTQQQRNTSTKICQFQGCGKGARGASGLCIAHGGGRRCQREGCNKGAEGRTVYCKAHGGGRRCEFLGCTKSAEGRTDYCIAHGGGRRCSHEGCTRASRGKSGLCIRHGGGKRCQMENCSKSAEGYSGLCISHGGGRRCQFPNCTKGSQGSTMFCKAHGGGKRCTVGGCTKGAEGSTPFCKGHGGGKRCSYEGGGACPKSVHGGTLYCVAHGGGKRCSISDCTKSARGRTDFCVRHGGGKRCQAEGCGKSAQGRTDFCKAHGGGKRCSWGQDGSDYGVGGPSCDRFARGKSGLCAAHGALVQDRRVHGGGTMGPDTDQDSHHPTCEKATDCPMEEEILANTGGHAEHCVSWNGSDKRFVNQTIASQPSTVTAPEGRVHGGSLMAMLKNGARAGDESRVLSVGPLEQTAPSYVMPRKWI